MESDSSNIIDILTEKGVNFIVEEGRLICDAPQGVIDKYMAERIKAQKQDIIKLILDKDKQNTIIHYDEISLIHKNIPLTQSQERFLFLEYLMKGVFAANLPITLKLYGKINVLVFRKCLQAIVDRHSILRTTFVIEREIPCQKLHQKCQVELQYIDYSDKKNNQIHDYEDFVKDEIGKHFNLGVLPLFKFFLIKLNDTETIFFFVKPSIIWDGWSYDIFLNELNLLYDAFSKNQPSPLKKLDLQFYDYSIWHRHWVESNDVKKQIEYWKKKLPARLPRLDLPFDRKRPPHFIYKGGHEFIRIPNEEVESLKTICKKDNLTMFICFLAAFKILLFRYTGNQEILIGLPMWNRVRPETEDLIGHFVNNILLLTHIDPESTYRQTICDVQSNFIEAFSNQEAPFEKLVEELHLVQSRSREPIYQVFFSYQDARSRPNNIGDLKFEQLDSNNLSVNNDLSFWLKESETHIVGAIDYSTDLFDEETIKRFLIHFYKLLQSCLKNPDEKIYKLEILVDKEITAYDSWVKPQQTHLDECGIAQIFKNQVLIDPDRLAIKSNDSEMTYGELDTRSDLLATVLKERGLYKNNIIGILMDRSISTVVSVLGILKSGNGFILLNGDDPLERVHQQIEDLQPSFILIQPGYEHIIDGFDIKFEFIDGLLNKSKGMDIINAVHEHNIACIAYVASSYDKPTGVLLTHKAILNTIVGIQEYIGINHSDTFFFENILSHSSGVIDILLPLLCGANLVIGANRANGDITSLIKIIDEFQPTIIYTSSEAVNRIYEAEFKLNSPMRILYSGKKLNPSIVDWITNTCGELWNIFGYEETAFWSACSNESVNNNDFTILSHPIGNTQLFILDNQMQRIPVGATGQLYIGGDGVANGYLNRKNIKNRFVENPYNHMQLFNTGDRARYLPNGTIELVKLSCDYCSLRGNRISHGEIENCMLANSSIKQAATIVIPESNTNQRIIGFFVLEQGQQLTIFDLETHLKKKLPYYMIPEKFVCLNEFPMLDENTIDKDSLSYNFIQSYTHDEDIIIPATETEKLLAEIWSKVLNIKRIGTNQIFFDLGGHSLLAVGLFSRINKVFGIDLPLALLFNNPTIQGIANRIDAELYIIKQNVNVDSIYPDENEDFEI